MEYFKFNNGNNMQKSDLPVDVDNNCCPLLHPLKFQWLYIWYWIFIILLILCVYVCMCAGMYVSFYPSIIFLSFIYSLPTIKADYKIMLFQISNVLSLSNLGVQGKWMALCETIPCVVSNFLVNVETHFGFLFLKWWAN